MANINNPITLKADVINFIASIVEKTINLLEEAGLTELEFFTNEDALKESPKFFYNFASWNYNCCDDTIDVYTQKVVKINGKWYKYDFDIMAGIEENPNLIIEQVLKSYDLEYAYQLYNAVYNKINNTNYKISIHE